MGPTSIATHASQSSSSSSSAAPQFPPGWRFYPSDQDLLAYYLTNKNQNQKQNYNQNPKDGNVNCNVIKEFDLYDYSPFELPESLCFVYGKGGNKRHWFFYTVKEEGNEKKSRRVKGGFWRRRGNVREVKGKKGVTLGSRIRFVFYQGKSLNCCVRTHWVMYEYNLLDHFKASFVVCRIYVKPRRQNSTSTNVISTFAEESDLAIRRCSNHDSSPISPAIVEMDTSNVNYIHVKIGISGYPVGESHDLDHPAVVEPVLPFDSRIPLEIHATEPVRSPGFANEGRASHYDIATQQLVSFVEDDFIELDDLLNPL